MTDAEAVVLNQCIHGKSRKQEPKQLISQLGKLKNYVTHIPSTTPATAFTTVSSISFSTLR
jgi:hypothetical protein